MLFVNLTQSSQIPNQLFKMDKEKNENVDGANGIDTEYPKAGDPFQDIMSTVGDHGSFQCIFNIIFVMGLAFAGGAALMNIIVALNVPDHWCMVPGREKTNFTLDEWRKITLPKEENNRGAITYSKCKMYDADFTEPNNWNNWNSTKEQTVCQNGWTYDDQWYNNTIPSAQNWVCDKGLFVTNAFVTGQVAQIVGTFILGQLADAYGRRIVYFVSAFACLVGRIGSIFLTSSYTWFLVVSSIADLAITSYYRSPQIIGMEISRRKDRSKIAVYQRFGWSTGISVLPLLFWWLRSWEPFMCVTIVPTFLILVFSKYVIESPRWLINKRRFADALVQLQKVAKINGRKLDMSEKQLTEMFPEGNQDRIYGMASLFNGWRLAKNSTIMALSWVITACSYFTMILFSSRWGGNPFLNFFLQNIVCIPAFIVGKYSADKFGRRFTNVICFTMAFIVCIPVIIYAPYEEYTHLMTGLATLLRFFDAMNVFTINLQSMEMYPTCLRQTGISFNSIAANAIGALAPYFVYVGTAIEIRAPFFIIGALFLLGAISASFLPETLNRKLPDTLEEAQNFGKNDKFFELPKTPQQEESTATEKFKQITDAF